MNFHTWLLQVGKSPKSAKSYSNAISGVITSWATKAGVIDRPLTEITSVRQLAELVDRIKAIDIFVERNTKGNAMYSSALAAYLEYLSDISSEDVQEDIQDVLSDHGIDNTEKATLVNARVGQGQFRRQLIDQWGRCALTGYRDPRFLVASHIKPWRKSTNHERLDPYNGLLLLPNLDKAFDLGYISFEDTGRIMISGALEDEEALGVRVTMRLELHNNHRDYMTYHRQWVFKSD
jgi:predicted restriction endonuclease